MKKKKLFTEDVNSEYKQYSEEIHKYTQYLRFGTNEITKAIEKLNALMIIVSEYLYIDGICCELDIIFSLTILWDAPNIAVNHLLVMAKVTDTLIFKLGSWKKYQEMFGVKQLCCFCFIVCGVPIRIAQSHTRHRYRIM